MVSIAPSEQVKHPAKFSSAILDTMNLLLPLDGRLLDPFAGTGLIHSIGRDSVGVEIEPEWAVQHPQNIVGNALCLPFADNTFRMAASSSTYGNRMADNHNAKDMHKPCEGKGCSKCWYRGVTLRHTYTHYLNRKLHPDNTGGYNWGLKYCTLHMLAWAELSRVLETDGVFVLNVKNHIRRWKEVDVVAWHREILESCGFRWEGQIAIPHRGLAHGANVDLRSPDEQVIYFRKISNDG